MNLKDPSRREKTKRQQSCKRNGPISDSGAISECKDWRKMKVKYCNIFRFYINESKKSLETLELNGSSLLTYKYFFTEND